MMTPSNGNGDNDRILHDIHSSTMLSMEMESLHPGATTVRKAKPQPGCLSQLCMLIKLHIEYYPKIFSSILLVLLAFGMYILVEWSRPSITRNRLTEDYSEIDIKYDFKAAQIDHWCMFGGDSACRCDDFTEPMPREEITGWLATHNANKARIKPNRDYDVVFIGDDVVEEMNGNWYNQERPDGKRIRDLFNETFTVTDANDSSMLDGLALGIAGDSASNVLWRLKHGEMPATLFSKVWWIAVGSSDLALGGCSEEVTTLGILKLAEDIFYNNPGSVVVIQGILPRSTAQDGSLEAKGTVKLPLFGKKNAELSYADRTRDTLQLWPSIQVVNKELEDFCAAHGRIVYFDATKLFVGSVGNGIYTSKSTQIVKDLMPDYVHLGYEGHKVLYKAIGKELKHIIWDGDEDNDVEVVGDETP